MNISNRTKISLAQILELLNISLVNLLFQKYSMHDSCSNIEDIKSSIDSQGDLQSLVEEIISTQQDLRSRISPRYQFDDRWNDLEKCLFLDGYKITDKKLISIEPNVDGVLAFEDDLTNEIKNSSLDKQVEIIQLINKSAESFKADDYNECLSKARIVLETIVKAIAENKFNYKDTWGRSLGKLKFEGFINQYEEDAIATTYTLVSNGSHIPLGFTDEEYSRYGRNLIMSICYYIVKRYKQNF